MATETEDSHRPASHFRSSTNPNYPDTVYEKLHSYDFAADAEFRLGLGSILGHAGQPATPAECGSEKENIVAAKTFYYSKKFGWNPPIQHRLYLHWLDHHRPLEKHQSEDTANETVESLVNRRNEPLNEPLPALATSAAVEPAGSSATKTEAAPAPYSKPQTEDETPYPSSFARIVELITTGQPIPGIQQIPDTVLTGQGAPSTANRRRKPWEKDGLEDEKADKEEKEGGNPAFAYFNS